MGLPTQQISHLSFCGKKTHAFSLRTPKRRPKKPIDKQLTGEKEHTKQSAE